MSFQRFGEGLLEDVVVATFSFLFCCTARQTLRLRRLELSEAESVLILLLLLGFAVEVSVSTASFRSGITTSKPENGGLCRYALIFVEAVWVASVPEETEKTPHFRAQEHRSRSLVRLLLEETPSQVCACVLKTCQNRCHLNQEKRCDVASCLVSSDV